ncbi:MAG: cupin domain-containing protein [Mariniphaga sp.]
MKNNQQTYLMTQSPKTTSPYEQIINRLDLQPHPEGGFYKEVYRSKGVIQGDSLGAKFQGERNYSTSIYFLLTSEVFSSFHRIVQDEIWHFYDGSPLALHIISPEGDYSQRIIGRAIAQGEVPQFVVPGGSWFGAMVIRETDFSLLGCTVAPGFDFRDFELATRSDLLLKFPLHSEIIRKLTRG